MKDKFKDFNLPIEERIDNLLSKMTIEEKVSQMVHKSANVKRLGIPGYNWWNECHHGVARAGIATVFPQTIGMAATWDRCLIRKIADAISDEARAKHHNAEKNGNSEKYFGLNFFSPNINIFRDPRWGRGQETYGEDPYLAGELALEFVKGLQGDDPDYLKLVATPKHFAVHSGPENIRHHFNVSANKKDMEETYLPAFKKCIIDGNAQSVMGAYTRLNGESCCASKILLIDILRKKWGFKGFVVSDCGAIFDIYKNHKIVKTPKEAVALAVKNGCDLNCGRIYKNLTIAVRGGLISEKAIDIALKRLFKARFKLGIFDPKTKVSYANIHFKINDSKKHRNLSLEAAKKSIVLLENKNNLLPINKDIKAVSIIGPNIDSIDALIGNYAGTPSKYITPLEGIRKKVSKETKIFHTKGCDVVGKSKKGFKKAVEIAQKSEIIIAVFGLGQIIESEEEEGIPGNGGDKENLDLPGVQNELLKTLYETGKPIILVLMNGSPITINWAKDHIPAIIDLWYPGQEGGAALADIIFGDYNPGGKLPLTFYKFLEKVPAFTDYSMERRTYRYIEDKPLYGFGYGLSYTNFRFSDLKIEKKMITTNDAVGVSIKIENIGSYDGSEVIQVYIKNIYASVRVPKYELKWFDRIYLKKKESKKVIFSLSPEAFSVVNKEGKRFVEPSKFIIYIGGSQPSDRKINSDINNVVKTILEIKGSKKILDSSF